MPSHRNTEPDPLRGSIDLLILKALSLESMHGWGIGARIQQMSRGTSRRQSGIALPRASAARAPRRHRKRLADDREQPSRPLLHDHRQGRRELGHEVDKWKRFAQTISLIVEG